MQALVSAWLQPCCRLQPAASLQASAVPRTALATSKTLCDCPAALLAEQQRRALANKGKKGKGAKVSTTHTCSCAQRACIHEQCRAANVPQCLEVSSC